jgi:hypothetical protein
MACSIYRGADMPNLAMKPAKSYMGDGRCLYCLETPPIAEMTDEHIVPEAIHGNIKIKGGACTPCARQSNKDYENEVNNNDLRIPRLLLGLVGKNKKAKKPDLRHLPPVYAGDITKGGNEQRLLNFPVELYPKNFSLMGFQLPGLLAGIDRGGELNGFRLRIFNIGGKGLTNVTTSVQYTNGLFAKTIAKIAYCYAVGELGLDGFEHSEIRDLLRGKRDDVYNFVGNVQEHTPLTRQYLHGLYIKDVGEFVTVLVDLFASCRGATDECRPYQVVVGRRIA